MNNKCNKIIAVSYEQQSLPLKYVEQFRRINSSHTFKWQNQRRHHIFSCRQWPWRPTII